MIPQACFAVPPSPELLPWLQEEPKPHRRKQAGRYGHICSLQMNTSPAENLSEGTFANIDIKILMFKKTQEAASGYTELPFPIAAEWKRRDYASLSYHHEKYIFHHLSRPCFTLGSFIPGRSFLGNHRTETFCIQKQIKLPWPLFKKCVRII